MAADFPGPVAGELEPRPRPPRLWPKVAHRLTQVFDHLTDAVVEKVSKVHPNDAQAEDLEEFEGALSEQLGIWFPDVAAGPGTTLVLAGVFIVAEKRWGAEPIEAKEERKPPVLSTPETPPPQSATNGVAHDADTSAEQTLLRAL